MGAVNKDSEVWDDDLGNLSEYGLCFDYVDPETFTDQAEGYWRYQLSWGGPGDEFRFYVSDYSDRRVSVHRIEYWFLDWFDGASRELRGDDETFMRDVFDWFYVCVADG